MTENTFPALNAFQATNEMFDCRRSFVRGVAQYDNFHKRKQIIASPGITDVKHKVGSHQNKWNVCGCWQFANHHLVNHQKYLQICTIFRK